MGRVTNIVDGVWVGDSFTPPDLHTSPTGGTITARKTFAAAYLAGATIWLAHDVDGVVTIPTGTGLNGYMHGIVQTASGYDVASVDVKIITRTLVPARNTPRTQLQVITSTSTAYEQPTDMLSSVLRCPIGLARTVTKTGSAWTGSSALIIGYHDDDTDADYYTVNAADTDQRRWWAGVPGCLAASGEADAVLVEQSLFRVITQIVALAAWTDTPHPALACFATAAQDSYHTTTDSTHTYFIGVVTAVDPAAGTVTVMTAAAADATLGPMIHAVLGRGHMQLWGTMITNNVLTTGTLPYPAYFAVDNDSISLSDEESGDRRESLSITATQLEVARQPWIGWIQQPAVDLCYVAELSESFAGVSSVAIVYARDMCTWGNGNNRLWPALAYRVQPEEPAAGCAWTDARAQDCMTGRYDNDSYNAIYTDFRQVHVWARKPGERVLFADAAVPEYTDPRPDAWVQQVTPWLPALSYTWLLDDTSTPVKIPWTEEHGYIGPAWMTSADEGDPFDPDEFSWWCAPTGTWYDPYYQQLDFQRVSWSSYGYAPNHTLRLTHARGRYGVGDPGVAAATTLTGIMPRVYGIGSAGYVDPYTSPAIPWFVVFDAEIRWSAGTPPPYGQYLSGYGQVTAAALPTDWYASGSSAGAWTYGWTPRHGMQRLAYYHLDIDKVYDASDTYTAWTTYRGQRWDRDYSQSAHGTLTGTSYLGWSGSVCSASVTYAGLVDLAPVSIGVLITSGDWTLSQSDGSPSGRYWYRDAAQTPRTLARATKLSLAIGSVPAAADPIIAHAWRCDDVLTLRHVADATKP